jgi:trehalose 6-phosphate synthase/phosphatase
MANLVIVSNRLPVSVKKVDGKLEFGQGMGGLATGLSGYTQQRGTKWIGWPGIPSEELTKADRVQITRHLRKLRCYPVFLTQKEVDDYYNGYSNSVIWPLFHSLAVKPHTARMWQAYRHVNAQFAEEVLRLSKPGSTIWVHDYQLMLVPQLLRKAGRGDQIGFFLHIPFPEPKVFGTLKEGKNILRGVLGADLAGFHTRGYTRQFLTTCDKLLELPAQNGRLLIGERPVRATEFPMGIDYGRFAEATKRRGSRRERWSLLRRYRGKKVIVTVDRLDITKGLVERLKAYQLLLRQQPKWRGKLVMTMIVAPSRTDIPEYKALKEKMDAVLAEINKEFASPKWQPIDFRYESVPLDSVMVLYQVADVAFIAPIRDGMNLVAKEFIASKRRNNGVLVLSKTAGAAEELQGAIQVDPKRIQTMVDGLERALTLPKRELRERARSMQKHIEEFTVQKWADSFMDVLQRTRSISSGITRSINQHTSHEIVSAYRQAKHRLFLLDYDGVLRRLVRTPSEAGPSAGLLKLLRELAQDPANEVVIISGRSKADLLEWLGDLPVALAAEHGTLFRRRGGKNWHKTIQDDRGWKQDVVQLMKYYADETEGALVEQKEWSVAWHYRMASPYYAQKNLVALRRLLKPIVKQYGLKLEEGNKVLEVRPAAISKGRIAQEWLIHDHDFILAAGDDVTDEDLFAAVPPNAYTVKVGRGKTLARYRIKSVTEILHLLGRM